MARRRGFGQNVRQWLVEQREDGDHRGHGRSLADHVARLREARENAGDNDGPGNDIGTPPAPPAPVVTEPAPVVTDPTPPAPVVTEPAPVVTDPTPPAPVVAEPAPVETDPTQPAPVVTEPAPVVTDPLPPAQPADNLVHGTDADDIFAVAAGEGYDGGAGFDTIDFSASTQGVSVDLGAGTYSGEFSGKLVNIERVVGSAYDDTLTGDAQDNVLVGGAGNDRIKGSAGQDTLTGGAGKDTFVMSAADTGKGVDVIKDFDSNDTLDMSSWFPQGVDPLSDGDIIDATIKFVAVNGGTMVQALTNGAYVDVVMLEGVSPAQPSAWATDSMLYVG